MTTLRIATCNVENLFSRAEVFVVAPSLGEADGLLVMIDLSEQLLAKDSYSADDASGPTSLATLGRPTHP